jgi:ribosome-binding protein aMBF1 (putative translation factor)
MARKGQLRSHGWNAKTSDATYQSVDLQVAGREVSPAVEGDLQKTVGRNVRAFRESRGLSQEALADLVKVHRTYLGGVERGERNLTLKSLERIAGWLDVDPLELLRRPDRNHGV